MMVMSVSSVIVQETHYDPWGLELTGLGYVYGGIKENKWKFQGQESIDEFELNWSSFKWRNHQPEIGRFFNVDPLADKFVHNSPYAFSENKVTSHVELEGLEAVSIQAEGRGIIPVVGNLSLTASASYGLAVGTRREKDGIYAVQYVSGSLGPAAGMGLAGGIGTYLNSGDLEDLEGVSFGVGGFLGSTPTGLLGGSFELNSTADGKQLGGLIPFASPGGAIGGGVWAEGSVTKFIGAPVNLSNMSDEIMGGLAESLGVTVEQLGGFINKASEYINNQQSQIPSDREMREEINRIGLVPNDATNLNLIRREKIN